MKRIAIVTNQMIMGGIEKSLITLLKQMIRCNCEVTLYLCKLGGELYNEIPEGVKVKDIFFENHTGIEIFKTRIKQGDIINALLYSIKVLFNKIDRNTFRVWNRSLNFSILNGENVNYDIAIAYGSPVSFSTSCIANICNAKKKYVWIHNEIDKIGFEINLLENYFDNFDKIFCVSKKCREVFLKNFSQYTSKTEVFYNFIDIDDIKLKANKEKGFTDSFNGIRLLTVGRICNQKGQDLIPEVLENLKDYSDRIKWYCIGSGEDNILKIKRKAREFGVDDMLLFLGNKNNPYPFFKECDIYIQPSRHEGFGITISEAKIFSKPIILTTFAGSDEQIENHIDGILVPFESEAISEAIRILINDEELRYKYGIAAYQSGISCSSDIRKIIDDV